MSGNIREKVTTEIIRRVDVTMKHAGAVPLGDLIRYCDAAVKAGASEIDEVAISLHEFVLQIGGVVERKAT